MFSIYGVDCIRLYWCNECFIFDNQRDHLVSSDTYGEIVVEEIFDVLQLPQIVVGLILQLQDCRFAGKKEIVKGKTPIYNHINIIQHPFISGQTAICFFTAKSTKIVIPNDRFGGCPVTGKLYLPESRQYMQAVAGK